MAPTTLLALDSWRSFFPRAHLRPNSVPHGALEPLLVDGGLGEPRRNGEKTHLRIIMQHLEAHLAATHEDLRPAETQVEGTNQIRACVFQCFRWKFKGRSYYYSYPPLLQVGKYGENQQRSSPIDSRSLAQPHNITRVNWKARNQVPGAEVKQCFLSRVAHAYNSRQSDVLKLEMTLSQQAQPTENFCAEKTGSKLETTEEEGAGRGAAEGAVVCGAGGAGAGGAVSGAAAAAAAAAFQFSFQLPRRGDDAAAVRSSRSR